MILGYKDVVKQLESYGRLDFIAHSVANSSDNFRKILEQLRPIPKRALEIGTHFGISSSILAGLCDYVYTVDVRRSEETTIVWGLFNVRHKIKYVICKDRDEIREVIKPFVYDFVFIDGYHNYANVKADYEMVAPRMNPVNILFHDIHCTGVDKFIEEIVAQKLAELAYLGDYKFKGIFTWKDRRNEY